MSEFSENVPPILLRLRLDDLHVEVVPDAVVVVVGVQLHAAVALPDAVRAEPRVAPQDARPLAVPVVGHVVCRGRFMPRFIL